MARKLKDIEVAEISLVDAAATLKKFFIEKRRKLMDWIEILKSFMGDEELTEEDIAKAEKLSEDAIKAIQGALNILKKYQDDFPQDVLGAIKVLTKYAAYGYPEKKKVKKGEEEEINFLEELTDVEKAGARLSKATIEQLQKINGIIQGLIAAEEKKAEKFKKEDLPKEVIEKLEELEKIKKEAKEKEDKEKEEEDKKFKEEHEQLKKDVEKLKKKKGVRKSVEGQEGDGKEEEEDDDEAKWPSLASSEEEGGKE